MDRSTVGISPLHGEERFQATQALYTVTSRVIVLVVAGKSLETAEFLQTDGASIVFLGKMEIPPFSRKEGFNVITPWTLNDVASLVGCQGVFFEILKRRKAFAAPHAVGMLRLFVLEESPLG